MLSVRITIKEGVKIPKYQTSGSAGLDICAFLPQGELLLKPGARALVPTGIFVEIPAGYEGQIRPRSGLAIKHGVTVLNSPGTIDSDYRGEIGVILINHSDIPFTIHSGDRICQLVIAKVEQVTFHCCDLLSLTERGAGGFGHTGV